MGLFIKLKNYLFEPRFHFSRFQLNLFAILFLSLGLIGGSYLALSKIFPNVFALNDNNHTWTFQTDTASQYTTGMVTVEGTSGTPIGAHPSGGQVGANKFANPDFSTGSEGGAATSWNVAAVAPTGWVEVPGSGVPFNTPNFLLMKYDAKAWDTQTNSVVADGGAGQSGGWAGNNGQTRYQARSIPDGRPWVYIAQNDGTKFDAKEACSALGANYHLVNNNEWMTAVRNAVQVASNWTNNQVGNGAIFSGHNDNVPAQSLAASSDDNDGYYLTGNSSPSNQRRTLTLSNGNVVWDMAGNVWQWNDNVQSQAVDTTAGWVEWNSVNVAAGAIDLYGPPSGYLSAQGMGQIYGGALNNAFQRGAGWSGASGAGPFALYLGGAPAGTSDTIGFRCASGPVAISQSFSSSSGEAGGGDTITIGSITDGKIYQSINVGDTAAYTISAYVYNNTGTPGGVVNDTVAQLYYGGNTISNPAYGEPVNGWYKLTGTVTGVNGNVDAGVLVKAGKTVKVDNITLIKQGTYSVFTKDGYFNSLVNTWDNLCEGTLVGSVCTVDATHTGNSSIKYQLCTDDLGSADGTGQGTACETGNKWKYWNGTAWVAAGATDGNTGAELMDTGNLIMQNASLGASSHKISVKAVFTSESADVPKVPHLTVGFTTDTTPPSANGKNISMTRSNGGTDMTSTCNDDKSICQTTEWTNNVSPYFTWETGVDNESGLKGYCVSLSLDNNEDGVPDNDPATAKGLLGTSPVAINGTTCQFIVAGTTLDLGTAGLKGSPWLTTSDKPYLLAIKAVDKSGNVFTGSSAIFKFHFDGPNTPPVNTAYISCASGNFSNVADMNFSWPVPDNTAAATDANQSGILGWQYQINSTSGTWLGTTTESKVGVNRYIPTSESSRTLTMSQDCPGGTVGGDNCSIVSGNNIVYLRSVDAAGNVSTDATIRTCNLSYGGAAPSFTYDDLPLADRKVTVTPGTSTQNLFALSWPEAMPTNDKTITHYYYMINADPPATLSTLQGNATTYIDNGTSRTVAASALPNVNKGANTVKVVAIDNASTPNYSRTNYIEGTFTLDSTNPDNVGNLVSSDSSIKSQSQWNVTLTWTAPAYQGAGNLTYLIYRSADGTSFDQVGSTSGLSYVDNAPTSRLYYYKVYTKDGANAQSSGTNAVSITPTGKWTSAPGLDSGPDVGSITTKKATVTWSTSRSADSKVQYGTESNKYGDVEPSNSSQTSSHSIQLSGLNPGTTYYFKAKWTDEDGNTGTSDEKSFTTASAPTVKDVSAKNIALTTAIIQFTSKDAAKVKIYYGPSTSFGGAKEISTSTTETTYTAELTGLADGTKYYYKINKYDSESAEYEGDVYSFETLPRPKISNVRIQQVSNTAQSTLLVTWLTNTEVSSIVTYYPEGNSGDARDEVNVVLTNGEHRLIIRGLLPQTNYLLVVKGRDKIGNEAVSDSQSVTTATDTRPPQISELHVEGAAIPPTASTAQESMAQLIVSWNTDEPATSQVEFGEGTGTTYSQKTQEDGNLTLNHLVIISNLTPSKVYHLRSVSKDKAGNVGRSIDTVTIAPKATENALNLVITNLQEAFGFVGGLKQ